MVRYLVTTSVRFQRRQVLGFTKCNIELATKWSALVAFVTYIVFAVFWLDQGQLPVAGIPELSWSAEDIYSGVSAVPRLVDPLIALVPAFLLFLPMFGAERTMDIFQTDEDGVGYTYVFGMLAGVIGSCIVANTGIPVAFWLGIVWSAIMLLILVITEFDYELWQPFMTTVVASVTGWCMLTLMVGTLAGLLYPAVCLLAGATLYFGVILIGWLLKLSAPFFVKVMLTCRSDRKKTATN